MSDDLDLSPRVLNAVRIAWHEAGHLVAARALGYAAESWLSINPDETIDGYTLSEVRPSGSDAAIITAAGPMAEWIFHFAHDPDHRPAHPLERISPADLEMSPGAITQDTLDAAFELLKINSAALSDTIISILRSPRHAANLH